MECQGLVDPQAGVGEKGHQGREVRADHLGDGGNLCGGEEITLSPGLACGRGAADTAGVLGQGSRLGVNGGGKHGPQCLVGGGPDPVGRQRRVPCGDLAGSEVNEPEGAELGENVDTKVGATLTQGPG